jgi:hypothetical protein
MRAQTILLPVVAFGLIVAGCKHENTQAAGNAGNAGYSASPAPGQATAAAHRGAPFPAEVVAIETDGTGITLKELAAGPTGVKEQRVVRVDPTTAATVAALKPGDRLMITCDETGAATAAGLPACSMVVAAAPQK